MRELKLGKTGVFWFVSRFFVKFSSSTWKPLASSTVNPLALFNLCMVAIRSLNASSIDLVGVNSISSEASREMSKLPTLFSIKPVLKKSLCVFWRKKKKLKNVFFFSSPPSKFSINGFGLSEKCVLLVKVVKSQCRQFKISYHSEKSKVWCFD